MNKIVSKMIFGAALLMLAACTQDEMPDNGTTLPEGKYPLEIASVTMDVTHSEQPWCADAPQTRVSENTDGNSSKWDGGETIHVKLGNQETTYRVTDSNGTLELTGDQLYWTKRTDNVTAWYASPETDGTINLANQSNKLAYVLQTTVNNASCDEAVNLSFTHSLAKVRVVLQGSYKKVDGVKIKTYTTCTYTNGNHVTGSNEKWITMHKVDDMTYEANVVPDQQITAFQVNGVDGTLDNGGITPLEAKVSTITLTVNARLTPASPITITDDGEYTITGSGDQTITINGSPTVTLDGVTISNDNIPIRIIGGSPTLIIKGKTTLTTTSDYDAGIQLEGKDTHVQIKGTGTLEISIDDKDYYARGAGIGSGLGGTCGNIYINGITAIINSDCGAGIGGGDCGHCGDIKIENANLTIERPEGAAAIGCGLPYKENVITTCGNIEIINSDITANVGNIYEARPAAIGCCGVYNNQAKGSCGNITITLKSGQEKDDFLSKLTIFGNMEKVGLGGYDDNLAGKVGTIIWKKADGTVIETIPARDIQR